MKTNVAAKTEPIIVKAKKVKKVKQQVAPAAPAVETVLLKSEKELTNTIQDIVTKPTVTRSPEAKRNIAIGLAAHKAAGRPTKQQLISVFGKSGYLLFWPQRTEKFGITPETFQAALAKGVPAVPLVKKEDKKPPVTAPVTPVPVKVKKAKAVK